MASKQLIGSVAVVVALGVAVLGWRLGRRYGAAIEHTGIGRPAPLTHSALAFFGNALVIIGLIGILMAIMLGFF